MPITFFSTQSIPSEIINPFSGLAIDSTTANRRPSFYIATPSASGISMYDATIARDGAPGSTKGNLLRAFDGDHTATPGQVGDSVTLSDPATTVRSAISATWGDSGGFAFTDAHYMHMTEVNDPVLAELNCALVYQVGSQTGLNLWSWGNRIDNMMTGVAVDTDRFTTFGVAQSSASNMVTATESQVQIPWPVAGTFQNVCLVYGSANSESPSVTVVLRKNEGDTALTFALDGTAGAGSLITDTSTTVSVVAGDLISWRIRLHDPSAGRSFIGIMLCGFVAG